MGKVEEDPERQLEGSFRNSRNLEIDVMPAVLFCSSKLKLKHIA